jgi:hypothetical protein
MSRYFDPNQNSARTSARLHSCSLVTWSPTTHMIAAGHTPLMSAYRLLLPEATGSGMYMDSPDSESRLKSALYKGGLYCLPIYISRKTRKILAAEMARVGHRHLLQHRDIACCRRAGRKHAQIFGRSYWPRTHPETVYFTRHCQDAVSFVQASVSFATAAA